MGSKSAGSAGNQMPSGFNQTQPGQMPGGVNQPQPGQTPGGINQPPNAQVPYYQNNTFPGQNLPAPQYPFAPQQSAIGGVPPNANQNNPLLDTFNQYNAAMGAPNQPMAPQSANTANNMMPPPNMPPNLQQNAPRSRMLRNQQIMQQFAQNQQPAPNQQPPQANSPFVGMGQYQTPNQQAMVQQALRMLPFLFGR